MLCPAYHASPLPLSDDLDAVPLGGALPGPETGCFVSLPAKEARAAFIGRGGLHYPR